MIVLSLFDGMSCGQIALERAGIKVDKYYASEIDKYAIQITQKNYPDTIQLGDIENWKKWDLDPPDLIIGGSPCQGFSFAGKQLNFEDDRSKLFFTFTEILNHYKPKYFFLENVKMKIEYERIITQYMNCYPIEINSALVSAQNRRRLYWTNIGQSGADLFGTIISGIKQPEDKGIFLKDILEPEVKEKYYLSEKMVNSFIFTENYLQWDTSGKGYKSQQDRAYFPDKKHGSLPATRAENKTGVLLVSDSGISRTPQIRTDKTDPLRANTGAGHNNIICIAQRGRENGQQLEPNFTGKTNALTSVEKDNYVLSNKIRRLTPVECERLQTIPDNYTAGVSDTQRYKMLGNGWTIDVIVHIFKHIKEAK